MITITDKRKSKPNWTTFLLSHIKETLTPVKLFGEEFAPNIGTMNSTIERLLLDLEQEYAKQWQGISPSVKFDEEEKRIEILNSNNAVIFVITETND